MTRCVLLSNPKSIDRTIYNSLPYIHTASSGSYNISPYIHTSIHDAVQMNGKILYKFLSLDFGLDRKMLLVILFIIKFYPGVTSNDPS